MKPEIAAPLIRGFCINLIGKPQTVLYKAADKNSSVKELQKAGAMTVEINSEETAENAAVAIGNAYEDWKKPFTQKRSVMVPSCIALCEKGKPLAFYWTGEDYDSALKRSGVKNPAPRKEIASGARVKGNAPVDTRERANVVKNRVALVTGGAQGIGEEIVRNLAAAGAFVYIADLNEEGAKKLAEEINAETGRTSCFALGVNVSDESSVEKMFKKAAETSGGLDLCVSNAGVLKAGSVLEQELPDFKFVTDINYTGFFVITKHAARLLRNQHRTAPHWKTDIVQINSKSGLEGSNKNGAYAGGKFGGLGLVASFAMELVEYNIKVNAICPGNFLDGPLWSHPEKGLFVQYLKNGKVPGAKNIADVRSFYEAKVPMKRGCTGRDLVRALYYIIEQEYETGQAVPVTGGQVMLH